MNGNPLILGTADCHCPNYLHDVDGCQANGPLARLDAMARLFHDHLVHHGRFDDCQMVTCQRNHLALGDGGYIIRASDPSSIELARYWALLAENRGVDPMLVQASRAWADRLESIRLAQVMREGA